MKLLLLKIRFFFSQPEVKLFFRVFFISVPIVSCTSYYAYPYITWMFEQQDMKAVYRQLESITAMPRSTNDNTVFEVSHIEDVTLDPQIPENSFWTGDALDYRYTVPKHGKPQN